MSRLDYTKNRDAIFRATRHGGVRPRVEFRVKFGATLKVVVCRDDPPENIDPMAIAPPPYGASEAERVAYDKKIDKAKNVATVVRNTGPKRIRFSTKGFLDMTYAEWEAFKEAVDQAIKDAVALP